MVELVPVKNILGKEFRQHARSITEKLTKLDATHIEMMERTLKDNG